MNKILLDLQKNGIHEGKLCKNLILQWNELYKDSELYSSNFKPAYNQYSKLLPEHIPFFVEMLPIIDLYYNAKSKIRDIHAVITLPKKEDQKLSGHAARWHTDLDNSVALMVLLNDITINDSHMEFIPQKKFTYGLRLENLIVNPKDIVHCIGEAGTFFLFNNGHYLHRAKLLDGNIRKTFHAIYLPI